MELLFFKSKDRPVTNITFPVLAVALGAAAVCMLAIETRGGHGFFARGAIEASPTQAVVEDTNSFLNKLDAGEHEKALFAFPADQSAIAATFKGGMNGRMNFV